MVETIYQTVKVQFKEENRNTDTRQIERSRDFLRDLITILLLNRLRRPGRPPHRPKRPPFPGPGMPPPRQPHREYPIY